MNVDLTPILQRLHKVNPYQEGYKACCPYHAENTPSFFIFFSHEADDYFFKCHGCGESGHLNKLFHYLQLPHLTYDTQHVTKNRYNQTVKIFRSDDSSTYPRVYEYYYSRGISKTTCRKFNLRYDLLNHAAIIPVYTSHIYQGKISRFEHSHIRYKIDSHMDMSQAIFGYDFCDPYAPVFCYEGCIDALSSDTLGFPSIALISKASWKRKKPLLKYLHKLIYIGDNDASGLLTSKELLQEGFYSYTLPLQYKDINDFLTQDPSSCREYLSNAYNYYIRNVD